MIQEYIITWNSIASIINLVIKSRYTYDSYGVKFTLKDESSIP